MRLDIEATICFVFASEEGPYRAKTSILHHKQVYCVIYTQELVSPVPFPTT